MLRPTICVYMYAVLLFEVFIGTKVTSLDVGCKLKLLAIEFLEYGLRSGTVQTRAAARRSHS